MSRQWFTPRNDREWLSQSSDGYYRVGFPAGPGWPFTAYHVAALWAKPEHIGNGDSIADAQQVCEQHAARNPAPV